MYVCRNTKDRNEIAHDNEEKSGIKSKEKKMLRFKPMMLVAVTMVAVVRNIQYAFVISMAVKYQTKVCILCIFFLGCVVKYQGRGKSLSLYQTNAFLHFFIRI